MNQLLGMKNVEYVGEQMNEVAVQGPAVFKVAKLVDLDSTRWNALAEKENTKSFIRMTGKQPSSYEEVKKWVENLITA